MLIEVLILIIGFIVFVGWAFWYRITTWWYRRKYNPDNDLSRKGEEAAKREPERREAAIRGVAESIAANSSTIANSSGQAESSERAILSPTASEPIGNDVPRPSEDSGNVGKASKGPGGFFNLFKRKVK